jgi:antitoxin component YwqK of YwqJK toxin-antitoxin module
MKNLLIILIIMIFNQHFYAQEIMVKNRQGEDIDINQIIAKAETDQPVLVYTYAGIFCSPCIKALIELQKKYPELKKNYNLKVIALNVDSKEMVEAANFKMHKQSIESVIEKRYGTWDFDTYYDYNHNFFKAIKAKGAPHAFLFVNRQLQFSTYGFTQGSIKEPEKSMRYIINIIEQSNADVSYFDKNWRRTTKNVNAFYKRYLTKVGNHYEVTDAWLSGEKLMTGQFLDYWGTRRDGPFKYYHKNGQASEKMVYVNNYRHGPYTAYYESGKIKSKGNYWEGKKDSVWRYNNGYGQETESTLYERGQKVSLKKKN